jgi:hypothetical protein
MKPISEEEKLKDFSNTPGSISQKLSAQWAIRHNNKNIRAARSAYSPPPPKVGATKAYQHLFTREGANGNTRSNCPRARTKEIIEIESLRKDR